VPEGFKVTLFAGEPDVQQPICFAFDDRGRIWVAECYTYSGHGFATDQKDRIVILADNDGDGRHDERKVFWEGGHVLPSLVWGFGGLFILENGQLQHLPDANRDDVPDGPPTVLLDGFDLADIGHNIVNGLLWGPDGWLYGRHGIQATSHVGPPGTPPGERTQLNASIWRYHPTRKEFEVLTHGTTNPWGLDYNDEGEFFFTNNVIGHLWHMIPGAHYERMYGADFNPHLYELMDQTADHYHWDADGKAWHQARDATGINSEMGGGHSHCGGMIYLGDNWPDEYRGRMFMCNTHGRRINQDILQRRGVSYVARHGPDFAFAGTEWFRGVQLAYGPDGGVFVSDWSDLGECHDNDGIHRTSGRIYKITYGDPKQVDPKLDIASLSNEKLVELQLHKNDWYVRHARRVLQERAVRGDDMSEVARTIAQAILSTPSPTTRTQLRLLWAYDAVASEGSLSLVRRMSADEHVLAWTIRHVANVADVNELVEAAPLNEFESLFPPLSRLYLASNLRKMRPDEALRLATRLASVEFDNDDPVQSRMIWYGIEPHVVANWMSAIELAVSTRMEMLRRSISRRLTAEIDEHPEAVNSLIKTFLADAPEASATQPQAVIHVLEGMSAALRGRTKAPMPQSWPSAYETLAESANERVRELAQELAIVFGDGRALDELVAVVQDANRDVAQRCDALATLAEHRAEGLVPVLFEFLENPALAPVAARGLANYDHPDTPRRILERWWSMKEDARAAAMTTLCSRADYARSLLAEVERDEFPRDAIDVIAARQIQALGDEELAATLERAWGSIRITSAEKQQLIERFKEELSPERLATANLASGQQLYQKKCATCHKLFGEGETTGPDLTGSDRRNLHYVLENIIDPSAVVPDAHRMSVIQTSGGRTITGVVLERNGLTIAVQTEKERIVVPSSEVESIENTALSLMPDGLLSDLTEDEVRDLVAYLGKR
jgi:putative membrane-bound dehydrogenase-like protein